MDFMSDALVNGRRIRALTIVDLWDRTSPALESEISLTGRRWRALERLRPQGRMPQFTGKALDAWAHEHGARLEFTRPGKPTDNGRIESFTGRLRDDCLNQNAFLSLADARDSLEHWRLDYNRGRPHGSLNRMTPEGCREKNKPFYPAGNANLNIASS
ncbi:integrase core domain-containing protein [uncultured Desulfovibrio sp.]|uniref:integrase core domain-containing protein n=1 Tax=uncultured Desulfovibrio sp. TaxID=167968 RepID=UPI00345C5442